MSLFGDAQMPERAWERIDVHRVKPFELMVLVLAEHGAPLCYGEIQARIAARGREVSVLTLQKAWHGKPPLRKTSTGELELVRELDPIAWDMLVWSITKALGLDWRSQRQAAASAPIDARSPITIDELRAVGRERMPASVGLGCQLGLWIEATGRPFETDELEALAQELGLYIVPGSLLGVANNKRSPIRRAVDGRWVVDSSSPSLEKARRFARQVVRRQQEMAQRKAQATAQPVDWKARELAERAATELHWLTASKRFVRTFYVRGEFVAGSVLDPDARSFAFFATSAELRAALERAEIVVGLDPRSEFERLGLDAGAREFVDLLPPAKSKTINRSGRKLRITPELVMRGTLGRSGALYAATKIEVDARVGRMDKVRRRLESDLKSLFALHDYAQGHGFVRLKWGFIDDVLYLPGKPAQPAQPLLAQLKHAYYRDQVLEVVLFGAPGWTDPWSRAKRCRITTMQGWNIEFTGDGWRAYVWFPEVHAARIVEP